MLFLLVFIVSLVIASAFGHLIHWLLHQPFTGPAYRGHMEHHADLYPPGNLTSKEYRAAKWYHSGPLLFTPPFIVILGTAWLLLHTLAIPHWVALTFGLTMLAFALFNDWAHDAFHVTDHWASRFAWYGRAQALHFVHHKHMRRNFGIVSFVYDRIFRTYRKSR